MTKPMRFILPAFIAISSLLPTDSALGQTSERAHSLEKGAWAVLYQMDGIRLTFYEGMLALKYHIAADKAFRFGLGGNASTNRDREDFHGGIAGQVHYLLYLRPEREVKFYLGAGPYVGYDRSRRNMDLQPPQRAQRWTLGIGGRLGTEWFATKSISVLAEYGNLLAIVISDEERTSRGDSATRDYSYRNSVTVGLSLYF